ncbi:MAG: aspartate aminotransferase family protein [Bdellovibrionales bacterium]|nr:aspartate aminotransferase family protein [Bdellovibrionales bacterium]
MQSIIDTSALLTTYGRSPIHFVRGEGSRLWDSAGKAYLDCLAGIAVVSAGHANPDVCRAVCAQAGELVHVSNLFWTEPMVVLAERLRQSSPVDGRVFFANSGAEANECAIKLARKSAGAGRFRIVCAEGSFHGRTLATLAATGQPGKWQGFEPLPEGFVHARFNDASSFADSIDGTTAAIFIEPILGEGGIIPAEESFLASLRELADEHQLALIFDEVQCGMGRTGAMWAHQNYGITPDIFTSAKALGNGFPIGACVASSRVADAFAPGDHGSTYGGGPVVCAAALASWNVIEGVLESIPHKAERFVRGITAIPGVQEVRGRGLMLAAVLEGEHAGAVAAACLSAGLIVNAVRPNVIRFTPPLVITDDEIDEACGIFGQAVLSASGA